MKMILDVDTGIDDALAIAYALGSEDVELLGITCCFGNVAVKTAAENSLSILGLLGALNIPVFAGENRTFAGDGEFVPPPVCRRVHGENGIGGVSVKGPKGRLSEMDAVEFLAKMAEKYGSGLAIIATGAQTNLARFIKRFPEQAGKVGKLAFMGGALTVPGNVTPYAEANILVDPDAARFVLESGFPVLMTGLDVTLRTSMGYEEMEQWIRPWKDSGTEAGEIFTRMVQYYCNNEVVKGEKPRGAIHDPMAVAAVIHPEWFTTIPMNLTAETEAPLRGRTIGDLSRLKDRAATAEVCIDADVPLFMEDFVKTAGKAIMRIK